MMCVLPRGQGRALAKWSDRSAVISDDGIPAFIRSETPLADAGRLQHMGTGPDRRLSR